MRRRILGVTGTRAEFGLLDPVFRAIAARPECELAVAVCGAHLLPPFTGQEVAGRYPIAAEITMQVPDRFGRLADAVAFGRGAEGFARTIDALRPDATLVLGDRIEAFAAASASAIAGVPVVHLHGGDRAEGVADESMRHAISKLAHLHCVATPGSGERLWRMGEDEDRIVMVGSPAIDDLAAVPPLDDATFAELGAPVIVVLHHPVGRDPLVERLDASAIIAACVAHGPTLVLHPNADPGREGIVAAIAASGVAERAHLPRAIFLGLLRRVRVLVGNSSAGLIEASAVPLRVINIGRRQAGRERAGNVIEVVDPTGSELAAALHTALASPPPRSTHPYGDGRTGPLVAELLAGEGLRRARIAKRNTY